MRTLTSTELSYVSGGSGCYTPPPPPCTPEPDPCAPTRKAKKGNNGFGNGGNDGSPNGKQDVTR